MPPEEQNGAPAGAAETNPIFSLDDAVAALDRDEEQLEPPSEAQAQPSAAPEKAEAKEEPAAGGEPAEAEPAEVPVAEEATEEPAPEAEPASEPEAEEFLHGNARTRLRDGREVTVAELKRAYGELQELTREAPTLAAQRQQLQQAYAQLQQREQFLQQTLPLALQRAQADIPPEPDKSLRETDPIEFFTQQSRRSEKIAEYQKLAYAHQAEQARQQQAQQQAQAQAEQQRQQQFQEYIKGEKQALLKRMPELAKPEQAKAFYSNLVETAKAYGFSEDEVNKAYDHRLMPVFRDAAAYRKLQASKPKVQEKAKDAPPVQQPGRRVTANEQAAKARQEQFARLEKTGDLEDAVALLNDL